MKRFKSFVRYMWTGLMGVCLRMRDFLRSREGRQMLIQILIIWGGEIIK